MPPFTLLTREEVTRILSVSLSTLDQMIEPGVLPKPRTLDGRRLYLNSGSPIPHAVRNAGGGIAAGIEHPSSAGRSPPLGQNIFSISSCLHRRFIGLPRLTSVNSSSAVNDPGITQAAANRRIQDSVGALSRAPVRRSGTTRLALLTHLVATLPTRLRYSCRAGRSSAHSGCIPGLLRDCSRPGLQCEQTSHAPRCFPRLPSPPDRDTFRIR